MITTFVQGDAVVYKEEQYTVALERVRNGYDELLLTKKTIESLSASDIDACLIVVPEDLQSLDSFLLAKCIELLSSYAQWEGALTTDDSDSLLESMSAQNYRMFVSLQEKRDAIGLLLSNKAKK